MPIWFTTDDSVSCNGIYVALNLTTHTFGIDTSWELRDRNNNTVVASESDVPYNQTYPFTECLHPRGCHDFSTKTLGTMVSVVSRVVATIMFL